DAQDDAVAVLDLEGYWFSQRAVSSGDVESAPIEGVRRIDDGDRGDGILTVHAARGIKKIPRNFFSCRLLGYRGTPARPRRVEGPSIGSSFAITEPSGRSDGDPQQSGIDAPLEPHDAGIGQLDLQLSVRSGIEHRDRKEGRRWGTVSRGRLDRG